MQKNDAPAAQPKAEPKSERVEDQAAELELVSRTVRNNQGVTEAEAKSIVQKMRGRALGDDLVTRDGTWTIDTSGTPVLLRKEGTLPGERPAGPQEG